MLLVDIKKRLGDLDLEVAFRAPGDGITALFGPSGSGKTSLVNLVAGLQRPDAGRIVLNGRTLCDRDKRICLPPEKRRVGYVFQDGRLFPHLSVQSNLTYGQRLLKPHQQKIELDTVVELLGIGHLLERRPARLSGGEKQRVAMGRALLTSPELLLMDEPLASLDEARKDEVLPFIARLNRELGTPVLYVSHSREEIARLTRRVIPIAHGRVAEAPQPNRSFLLAG